MHEGTCKTMLFLSFKNIWNYVLHLHIMLILTFGSLKKKYDCMWSTQKWQNVQNNTTMIGTTVLKNSIFSFLCRATYDCCLENLHERLSWLHIRAWTSSCCFWNSVIAFFRFEEKGVHVDPCPPSSGRTYGTCRWAWKWLMFVTRIVFVLCL
jgi:hypothetical protein